MAGHPGVNAVAVTATAAVPEGGDGEHLPAASRPRLAAQQGAAAVSRARVPPIARAHHAARQREREVAVRGAAARLAHHRHLHTSTKTISSTVVWRLPWVHVQ